MVAGRGWVAVVLLAAVACGGDPAPVPGPSPAAPTVPAVDADFAGLTPTSGTAAAVPGATVLDPRTARLEGPHFAYSVTAVARVAGPVPAAVGTPFGIAGGAAPAAGQELVLLDLARTAGRPAVLPTAEDPLVVEVAAGSARRTVPVPPPGDLTGTVAVSLPAGARPVLRVTDAGRRQSLDLSTGRRGGDAIAGYYPVPGGSWDADDGRPTGLVLYGPGVAGLTQADRTASVQLDDTTAELQPYRAGRGWAGRGRAFLVLDVSVAYGRANAGSSRRDTVTIPPACFRVTGPDGAALRVAGDPLVLDDSAPGAVTDGELVADVPAGLRRVTVRFAFCGSIATPAGATTYQVYADPSQTAALVLR